MNGMEPERIDLAFRFADFDSDSDENDDDDPCNAIVNVTRIGEGLFQVYEPTSLTPFGLVGTFLGLGTKIRVKKMEGGAYRLAEILEAPEVWTWQFPARQECLNEGGVSRALEALTERDCRWEFCSGNFTIQRFRLPNETSPDASLVETIRAIHDRVVPAEYPHPRPTDGGTEM